VTMAEQNHALIEQAREVLARTFNVDFSFPVIAAAAGTTITDVGGRQYLDFSSGQMCATLGHGHPAIVAAVQRSAAGVMHLNSSQLTAEVIHLARRLVTLLPAPLRKVVFLSTGGESTEMAIKIAKKATGKFEIVALTDSFHGSTQGASSSTYIAYRRSCHGPTMPGTHAIPAPSCYRCPLRLTFPACDYACLRVGFELVDRASVGSLAAFIMEPIQGTAGTIEPPPGYLDLARSLCRDREMLFMLDEAQTGLGRTGDMWGFEQDGAVPDVLAISKTLGGGVPLAATVMSPDIEERCFQAGFWFYTSHLNEPMPCAVGLAVLETLEQEQLVAAARQKGAYLKSGLLGLKDKWPVIGDVRGRGLLLGVDFVEDRESKKPAEADGEAITRECLKRGLFVQPIRQRGRYFVWRVAPPLTVSYPELDRALSIIDEAVAAACGR
jgi:2,2-dialkylglycine decarboxylase (pyruvate)